MMNSKLSQRGRTNKINLMLISFLVIASIIIPITSAEVSLWTDIYINHDTQTVSQYGYYQFDDTSARGVGRDKAIEMILWYEVEGLPYDLSIGNYSGYVDWCNLTIRHDINEYGGTFYSVLGLEGGNYINTTTETDNYYFENTTTIEFDQLYYFLKDKDSLTVDMKCHYTDPSSVFVESILFGRVNVILGAYECNDCEEYSFEQLSNEIDRSEQIISDQNEVYDKIQSVVAINFNIWLIVSWIIKIGLLFTAVTLVFGGIYWLYLLFKSIEDEI
jgi:hypothetical protein